MHTLFFDMIIYAKTCFTAIIFLVILVLILIFFPVVYLCKLYGETIDE